MGNAQRTHEDLRAQEEPASRRRHLRALAERYRKRSLAAGACALVLAGALVLVATGVFEGTERVLLGTGRASVMSAAADSVVGEGEASYYGAELEGRPTASGESFDPGGLTAAHRTLPLGSKVRVTNLQNDESVVVRINDRGPYHGRRILDLSRRAAERIGMLASGKARVKIELLNEE